MQGFLCISILSGLFRKTRWPSVRLTNLLLSTASIPLPITWYLFAERLSRPFGYSETRIRWRTVNLGKDRIRDFSCIVRNRGVDIACISAGRPEWRRTGCPPETLSMAVVATSHYYGRRETHEFWVMERQGSRVRCVPAVEHLRVFKMVTGLKLVDVSMSWDLPSIVWGLSWRASTPNRRAVGPHNLGARCARFSARLLIGRRPNAVLRGQARTVTPHFQAIR